MIASLCIGADALGLEVAKLVVESRCVQFATNLWNTKKLRAGGSFTCEDPLQAGLVGSADT